MDISNLPKPALFNLLLQIEPDEIRVVCGIRDPKIKEICYSNRFIEEYKIKYKTEEQENLVGFNAPVILKPDLSNFLLDADFKKFNSEIHEIIDPLIKRGIFNRSGLLILFLIYLNDLQVKLGNRKRLYKTDEKMNKYLNTYFKELEKITFSRYKFPPNNIQNIISKTIVPFSEYSVFDDIIVKDKKIQKLVLNASKKIEKISRKIK